MVNYFIFHSVNLIPIFACRYPAPGNRHVHTGTMTGVGDIGFSQSSTIYDIRGHHLLIGVNRLYPSYTDPRAYGLQLRCLSE